MAFDLTARVHGNDEAKKAVRVSEAAFSKEPIRDPEVLGALFEAMDGFEFTADDTAGGAMRVAIVSALYSSNGDARRAIQQGGLSINDERVAAVDSVVPALVADRYLVLRAGKKSVRIGRLKG
jgi:tyrosyl-tRNA synthetase